jgi:hypothetical protein
MNHFDIIKAFHNEKEWEKITNSDKSKNFFMLNRTMAIMYPLHAQGFNHIKMDPVSAVNWWKTWILAKHPEGAGFIYTSTGKKKKEAKKEIPEEVSNFLREKWQISSREIEDLKEFYPKEFQKYCESVKEMIS